VDNLSFIGRSVVIDKDRVIRSQAGEFLVVTGLQTVQTLAFFGDDLLKKWILGSGKQPASHQCGKNKRSHRRIISQ
jgi:hypothetical protein